MQPLIKLLEILPNDQAAAFIVEAGRQNDSNDLTGLLLITSTLKPTDLLATFFSWKDSRQGSDYWQNVFKFVESQEGK